MKAALAVVALMAATLSAPVRVEAQPLTTTSTPTVTDDVTALESGTAEPGQSFDVRPGKAFQSVSLSWTGPSLGTFSVRALTAGSWSLWSSLDSDSAANSYPAATGGRDVSTAGPLWVGHTATEVQVAVVSGALPGLELHALNIGGPAGVTAATSGSSASAALSASAAAGVTVPPPPVVTRAGWGANEAWRTQNPGCGNPDYAPALSFAVVHHTDNVNNYGPADSVSIVQAIYYDHVFLNGWCDIGYNFLIDQFGQVFEGRFGGVAQPVVGAHAGGYNTGSVGIALIGNFDAQSPSPVAYDSLTQLIAWKFSLAGIDALGQVTVTPGAFTGSRYPAGVPITLPTIVGHRDVDSTDCPGQDAYNELPQLRNDVAKKLSPVGLDQVASDGGVFTVGHAGYFGSTGNLRLNKPVVGMAPTATGQGYWLVASDGGIFTFGDAAFHGSTGNLTLNKPIVGMAPTTTGKGYWLVASDGGIFTFGDAAFYGSTGGNPPTSPIVAIAAQPGGGGYALTDGAAQVFGFGSAGYLTQPVALSLTQPVVGATCVTA